MIFQNSLLIQVRMVLEQLTFHQWIIISKLSYANEQDQYATSGSDI